MHAYCAALLMKAGYAQIHHREAKAETGRLMESDSCNG